MAILEVKVYKLEECSCEAKEQYNKIIDQLITIQKDQEKTHTIFGIAAWVISGMCAAIAYAFEHLLSSVFTK